MQEYMWQVMLIHFVVDVLLMVGVRQLHGVISSIWRVPLAALYGSILAGCSLLPATSFLHNPIWQILCVVATGVISYGTSVCGLRACLAFSLLYSALITASQSRKGLLVAGGILTVCMLLQNGKRNLYVPVVINHNGRKLSLTALRDTGNCLRDPVTGKPVLIVDALAAEGLIGLSGRQLGNPINAVGTVPGLRLIPYKTVGGTGLLLALWLQDVKIGSWQGSSLVAFSPEIFSTEGLYQALTGGRF